MPMSIDWSQMAHVDLLGVGEPSVMAELLQVAQTSLDQAFLPPTSEDQGIVQREPEPGIAWRRGITHDDAWRLYQVPADFEDQSRYRACDYVLVYRLPTEREYTAAAASTGRKIDYVIVRVLPSATFAQHLTHDVAERALELGDPWTQLLRALSEG
jgi:hypothetical protein